MTISEPWGMKQAAISQARDRADRERERMTVWLLGETWFVRSDAEGRPEGAEKIAEARPAR
jgi:hypothetical protein